MPPSTRRTPKETAGGKGPPLEPRGVGPAGRDEPTGAGQTAQEQDDRTTMSVRLPFMTLSVSRPRQDPAHAPGTGEQAHRGGPGTTGAPGADVGSGERLLFYTGLAALGAVGVLEWPVAAAIAAGTYLAARIRPTPPRTPASPAPALRPASPPGAGAPGGARSAGAARTELPDAPAEVSATPDV
jgi:hypothetical protein